MSISMTHGDVAGQPLEQSLPQLPHRNGVVYGPIQSRRIGQSLGVNLLPASHRVCSFDCVYCQFPSPFKGKVQGGTPQLIRSPEIHRLIETGIRQRLERGIQFDSISFVGNGDPSVHPDLLEITEFTRGCVAELCSGVGLAIFTDAVPYDDGSFLRALRLFDQRLIKLDAGDAATFHEINKPRNGVCLEDLAAALGTLDGVIIQTMIITGLVDNRRSITSDSFAKLVGRAGATEVQLCTIDKRPAYEGVLPVTEEELQEVADALRAKVAAPVNVYYQDCPSGFPSDIPPCADLPRDASVSA